MKKTLAILLAVALIICMIPATAFADTTALTADMVSLNYTTQLYTGSNARPTVSITNAAETTDYTIDWGSAPASNLPAATYTITVTPVSGSTVLSGSAVTKTFTVAKVDFTKANTLLNYTGSLLKSDYTDWASKAIGAEITLPSGGSADISVTQDGTMVSSSLYTAKAIKLNNDQIRISATTVSDASGNVIVGTRYKDYTLATTLAGYKIIGTGSNGIIPDQTYTGSPLTPTIYVVPVANTGNSTSGALTLGSDYKAEYTNNTNGGSIANVTVTGQGKYTGTLSSSFTIVGRTISGASITVNNTVQYQAPKCIVKYGSDTLVENTDYTVTYDSSVIGSSTGRLTITGINNYSGTRTASYTVAKYDITSATVNTFASGSFTYNGATQTGLKPSLTNGTTTLYEGTHYSLEYEYTDKKTAKTVVTTTPKDANSYTVYAVGRGDYGGRKYVGSLGINQVAFTTSNYTLNITASQSSSISKPTVSVKTYFSGVSFIEGTDFTVGTAYVSSYTGKGSVLVSSTGTGNLAAGAPISITYDVASRYVSSCTAYFAGYKTSVPYTGSNITLPELYVYDGSTRLTEGTHYSVSYKNALGTTTSYIKDAGTYTVVITGKGLYTGTKELTFTVTGTDISSYTVTLKDSSVNATGYSQIPSITSVAKTYTNKLSTSDYTVSYKDSTGKVVTTMSAPGTYTVVVTGKNGYMGNTTATFRIVGTPQTITVDKTSYKVYTDSDTFKITASATGDGTGFSYVSSDPSVATVSSTGYVTVYKLGRAKITVTTTGTKKSDPATEEVYVKVYPKKTALSQKPYTNGKTKSFKVRWDKQDNVTYYQIRYSKKSNFAAGSYLTKTVNQSTLNYATQSTTISGVTSGYRYYVKVRAVKEVKNDYGQTLRYYGKWANWRSVVVK